MNELKDSWTEILVVLVSLKFVLPGVEGNVRLVDVFSARALHNARRGGIRDTALLLRLSLIHI